MMGPISRLWVSVALIAVPAASASAATAPMLGFAPASAEAERALEDQFDAGLSADAMRDRLQADVGRAQPGRLAARQGQRRIHPGAVQGLGLGRAHRGLLGPLSDAQGRSAGAGRPDAVHRHAHRAADPWRRQLRAPGRRPSRLRRLWRRRRRHRAADLRQLRHAGRLRGASAPGPGCEGQDRHRPLRRAAGAASSPSSRRSTARSAASSIPIRPTTATGPATPIRRAPSGPSAASSAARSWTCRSSPAIR